MGHPGDRAQRSPDEGNVLQTGTRRRLALQHPAGTLHTETLNVCSGSLATQLRALIWL